MGLLFLTAAEDNNFPRIISSWSAIKLPASKLNYGYSWSENNFAYSSPSPPSSFSALFHVPYFFHHIGFWRFSLLVFDDSELISALSSCFYCCLMLFLLLRHHQLSFYSVFVFIWPNQSKIRPEFGDILWFSRILLFKRYFHVLILALSLPHVAITSRFDVRHDSVLFRRYHSSLITLDNCRLIKTHSSPRADSDRHFSLI